MRHPQMLYDHTRVYHPLAPLKRETALTIVCTAICVILLAMLVARGLIREPAGASSFAALADAFLHGRLSVNGCPEIDCAVFNGQTYIIFPPLPALLLMPVVAITGLSAFKGAVSIAIVLAAVSLVLWRRIFEALRVERAAALWLVTAVAFSSPLYYVVLKGNGAWFFAQTVGFLMATLAIASVILWRSLALACLFAALGFLCRQMLIFYPLFLLVLALRPDEKLLRPSLARISSVALAALPVIAGLGMIFAYNYARFGNPLDTGYAYINNPGSQDYISGRIADYGLFSTKYLLFNLYHLFLQGFHAEFNALHQTGLTGIDWNGTALLIACPWIALMFYMHFDRVAGAGLAVIAVIAGITLFYHSNGYAQIGAMRYVLDWMPGALVLMARSTRPDAFRALPLLVTLAIAMNAMAIATAMFAAGK